jgi:Flp pilus assembly protein CpaB
MKNQRRAILIAAILAAATFIGVQLYVEIKIATATKHDEFSAVRIKKDIKPTDVAKDKALKYEHVEKIKIHKEAADLLDKAMKWERGWESAPETFNGNLWRTKRDLKPGTVILESDVERESPDPKDLNSILKGEPNVRAITVPVSATSLHGGLLEPDSRVDVLGVHTVYDPDGKTYRFSRTLLQNVKVIAVNGIVDVREYRKNPRKTGGNLVTLALPPRVCEGLYLFVSQAGTEISLLVRNPDQKTITEELLLKPKRIDNLFSSNELESDNPFLEYFNRQRSDDTGFPRSQVPAGE